MSLLESCRNSEGSMELVLVLYTMESRFFIFLIVIGPYVREPLLGLQVSIGFGQFVHLLTNQARWLYKASLIFII